MKSRTEAIAGISEQTNQTVESINSVVNQVYIAVSDMAAETGNNSKLAADSRDTIRELFSIVDQFKM